MIPFAMEIFYEDESMKKMKFIGLFCMCYWYNTSSEKKLKYQIKSILKCKIMMGISAIPD